METNTPQNSQEMNEALDRLHPETATPDYPAQYLLVNEDYGTVIWCESHHTAVQACKASPNGGIIINTATADPALVARTLATARRNMDAKPTAQPNQDSRSRLAPTDADPNTQPATHTEQPLSAAQ